MNFRFRSTVLMVSAFWTAYALVYASHVVNMRDESNRLITWGWALSSSLVGWMSWIPLSLGVLWVVRKFPFRRANWFAILGLHSLTVMVLIVLRALYVAATNPWIHWYADFTWTAVFVDSVRNNFLLSWLVIGVAHALIYAERARRSEVILAQLQQRLSQAELAALSARVNPHFLFNSLNSIAELMHQDAHAAERMVLSLSILLRRSLAHKHTQLCSLAQECELLEHYLSIEKIRLGERLKVNLDVAPSCMALQIPTLLLQPLAENAILHGIAKLRRGGEVSIHAYTRAEQLHIRIENDMPVSPDVGARSTSLGGSGSEFGLAQAQERLQHLYGERASLTTSCAEGKFKLSIDIALAAIEASELTEIAPPNTRPTSQMRVNA